jgi:hypothetical protein
MSEIVEQIDKFALDEDCIRQPQLFQEAADEATNAAEQRDLAKLDMETTLAELDLTFRREASGKGERLTDKAIESLVNNDERYIKSKEDFIHTKMLASLADNKKTAYEQRKSMLEYIIRLYLSEYYSDVESNPDVLSRKIAAGGIKKTLYKNKETK